GQCCVAGLRFNRFASKSSTTWISSASTVQALMLSLCATAVHEVLQHLVLWEETYALLQEPSEKREYFRFILRSAHLTAQRLTHAQPADIKASYPSSICLPAWRAPASL